MTQTTSAATGAGEECELCGGCGEVEVHSALVPQGEIYGCPLCIAAEKNDALAALREENERLREKLEKSLQSEERKIARLNRYADEVRVAERFIDRHGLWKEYVAEVDPELAALSEKPAAEKEVG